MTMKRETEVAARVLCYKMLVVFGSYVEFVIGLVEGYEMRGVGRTR